jgi:hypothetical protein
MYRFQTIRGCLPGAGQDWSPHEQRSELALCSGITDHPRLAASTAARPRGVSGGDVWVRVGPLSTATASVIAHPQARGRSPSDRGAQLLATLPSSIQMSIY